MTKPESPNPVVGVVRVMSFLTPLGPDDHGDRALALILLFWCGAILAVLAFFMFAFTWGW